VDTIGMRKFHILMNCPRVILFTIVQYHCRVLAFHLLNEYTSETIDFPLSVVEFHRLYTLPKEYLQSVASGTPLRLRLLPPYREHLSQAFARYFMRVGLPIDIPKERVKDYK
jgi:hypothetical protein